ncbi:MAG: hypothetical protein C0398_02560 [Coprothermobacter sp.]|nr:hypothetical protein [Coprothermobacter sp.]
MMASRCSAVGRAGMAMSASSRAGATVRGTGPAKTIAAATIVITAMFIHPRLVRLLICLLYHWIHQAFSGETFRASRIQSGRLGRCRGSRIILGLLRNCLYAGRSFVDIELEFERSSEVIGVARSRGVELIFDTGRGIDKQGLWPMEVLVASLGGCLNLDLGAALQESDYAVDRLTMTITGHRDDDIPAIDRITCHIDVWSPGLSQPAAEELLAYALGRSTIYNTLARAVKLDVTIVTHTS